MWLSSFAEHARHPEPFLQSDTLQDLHRTEEASDKTISRSSYDCLKKFTKSSTKSYKDYGHLARQRANNYSTTRAMQHAQSAERVVR